MSACQSVQHACTACLRKGIQQTGTLHNAIRRSMTLGLLPSISKSILPSVAISMLVFAGNPVLPMATASESASNDISSSTLPEISIIAVSSLVSEGQNVNYAVMASEKSSEDLIVSVRVVQSGDYILWRAPGKISIPAGRSSAIYTLETEDDNSQEANGHLTLTVVSGDGYRLGYETSATVEILDNDSEFSSVENSKSNVVVAGAVANLILEEMNLPKITISPASEQVSKGQEAVFILSAEPQPVRDLEIDLKVFSSGGSAVAFTKTVNLSANTGSLRIPLEWDRIFESESISVSVSDGVGFRAGSPSEAEMAIEK